MSTNISVFTVLFEDPFWVGLFERNINGRYEVCKIVFGAEPKDNEVYKFFIEKYNTLKFSEAMNVSHLYEKHINPKRMQRIIHNQMCNQGISTKAQQALKFDQQKRAIENETASKIRHEEDNDKKYLIKRHKQRARHKGH